MADKREKAVFSFIWFILVLSWKDRVVTHTHPRVFWAKSAEPIERKAVVNFESAKECGSGGK